MLNGLYVATSGLMMQEKRVETISNNLANVNTAGYKKDVPVFNEYIPHEEEFPQDFIRSTDYNKAMNSTVKLAEESTDFEMGYIKETGNKLDFALSDENAFFTVDTPYGIRYTRAGQFTINENNELVTASGHPVLSNVEEAPQPIVLPENFTVAEDGTILADGAAVTQLGIAQFEDTENLQKVGHNLYAAVNTIPEESDNPGVINGYLEMSNVNAVREMTRMIEASRGFETYQKVVQTIDQLNSNVINNVGKYA
ncbi:flagellar basal-body rod protein FlgF [Limisalsivibrio acetivorans]|uniref:flagellar basal-body rod protein FlgF n=1 Tax=Limisalsivibrio acetivorans TaxID=1304888 RepID=UPI0003B68B63|nr:flagellar basal-body rod protein FlgF [Limisalsivibrio acetivorans]